MGQKKAIKKWVKLPLFWPVLCSYLGNPRITEILGKLPKVDKKPLK